MENFIFCSVSTYTRYLFEVQDIVLIGFVRSLKVVCPLGCGNISKLLNGQNVNTKDLLLCILNINITHIKNENETHIRQSPGTYIFITNLREMVNQTENILMKTKIDINLSTYKTKRYKISIILVFEKVVFHFKLRNIPCPLLSIKCRN